MGKEDDRGGRKIEEVGGIIAGVTELERTRMQGAHFGTLERRTVAGDMSCTRWVDFKRLQVVREASCLCERDKRHVGDLRQRRRWYPFSMGREDL